MKEAEQLLPKYTRLNRIILGSVLFIILMFWLLLFFRDLLITSASGSLTHDWTAVGVWRANNALVYVAVLHLAAALLTVWLIAMNLGETRKILKQAEDTTRAADRTTRAAENAERAHVFFECITEFCGDVPSVILDNKLREPWLRHKIRVTPQFYNYGRTPATGFCATVAFDEYCVGDRIVQAMREHHQGSYEGHNTTDLPDLFVHGRQSSYRETPGQGIIGPNKPHKIDMPIQFESLIKDEENSEYEQKEAHFYAEWSYTDVFDGKPTHTVSKISVSLNLSHLEVDGDGAQYLLNRARSCVIKQQNITEKHKALQRPFA